jgi:uncharacterized HAD superfamily protein
MLVAVDIDGVLLDTMECFCRIYNELYDDIRTKADITRFGFFSDWGMTEEEFWVVFRQCDIDGVKVINKRARKYMKKIADKHYVDIVTARSRTDKEGLEKALKSLGIIKGIHYHNLMLTLDHDIESKAQLNYQIFIDDNPNLAKLVSEKPYGVFGARTVLLWDQPWNWQIVNSVPVTRVSGWKDIMKWFKNHNL